MLLQYDWKTWTPQRGEIYLADLGETLDSEQSGIRPVLIISNNIGNIKSSIVTIVPLTTKNKCLPVHVSIGVQYGLKTNSCALTEHTRSISKRRFFTQGNKPVLVGKLTTRKMMEIEEAIKIELGMIS